jgi:hypothetical protein
MSRCDRADQRWADGAALRFRDLSRRLGAIALNAKALAGGADD